MDTANDEIKNLEELKALQREIIAKGDKCKSITLKIVIPIIVVQSVLVLMTGMWMVILGLIPMILVDLAFAGAAFLIARNFATRKELRRFNYGFKRVFVLSALEKIFDELSYAPDQGLPEYVIGNTGMMDMGDRYKSNDYISGKYKGISFEQSDVSIQEKREETDKDGNEHTYYETIFLGRWMIFDFNKKFLSNVQVASKGFEGNRLGGHKKYARVRLEDAEFNKIFTVYAENEFEAFYVLPPDIMERMKKIKQILGCNVMFCFVDTKLHIAINNGKDSFECNAFKEIDEAKIINEISEGIRLITQLAEELKLDRKVFSN